MEGAENVYKGGRTVYDLRDQGRHLGGGVSGAPGQVPECYSGNEAVSVFFPREDKVGER